MIEYSLYIFVTLIVLGAYFWNENKGKFVKATTKRDWIKNHSKIATVVFKDETTLIINNMRDTKYTSENIYTTEFKEDAIDLSKIKSAYIYSSRGNFFFIHMFMTFEFIDDKKITISVKMRRYKGVSNWMLNMKLTELLYVVALERDILSLRTKARSDTIKKYKLQLSNKELQKLFIDILKRVNKLATEPEFYSLFSNNCFTNLFNHINRTTHFNIPLMHYSYFMTPFMYKMLQKVGLIARQK